MTTDEIQQLIREIQAQQCELDDVEVKAAHRGTPNRLYDSFSALANRTGGGVLLFGVDEAQRFAVVGVHDAHRLIADVTGKATDEMEPPLRLEFAVAEVDGLPVVAAEVPETPIEQKPCYYKAAGLQHGAYLRVGGTDRQMTDYEVFGFVSNRVQQEHDRTLIADATLDDLDRDRLETYITALRAANPEAAFLQQSFEVLLKSLRLVQYDHGVLRPTLAGLLMFGVYPQAIEPQLVVVFLHYFGTTEYEAAPNGARFLDNKKFEGSIPAIIEKAYPYILKAMRQSTLVNGLYHEDIPEYPREAFREAIINAVMHRDYSPYARASHIQVRLFADRLEIVSPGCLYGNVTVENLEEKQSTRNRQLMRFAEDLRLVENRGSGINTMLLAMQKATMEPPVFEDNHSEFKVIFYNRHLLEPETLAWLESFTAYPFNAQQRMALAFLRHRGRITNNDYRHLNSVDMGIAARDLRGLVQAGVVVQQEQRRWTYYKLGDAGREGSIQLPLTPQLSREEEAVLVYLREHGEITNQACCDLLGCQPWQAKRHFQSMIHKRTIQQLGKTGRNVKYVLIEDTMISKPSLEQTRQDQTEQTEQ